MPPRDWKLRIKDILDGIDSIHEYTKGMEYKAFVADRKTVDAVIQNLSVIGEAASHIPDDVISAHSDIPWRDMRDMLSMGTENLPFVGIENLPPLS